MSRIDISSRFEMLKNDISSRLFSPEIDISSRFEMSKNDISSRLKKAEDYPRSVRWIILFILYFSRCGMCRAISISRTSFCGQATSYYLLHFLLRERPAPVTAPHARSIASQRIRLLSLSPVFGASLFVVCVTRSVNSALTPFPQSYA